MDGTEPEEDGGDGVEVTDLPPTGGRDSVRIRRLTHVPRRVWRLVALGVTAVLLLSLTLGASPLRDAITAAFQSLGSRGNSAIQPAATSNAAISIQSGPAAVFTPLPPPLLAAAPETCPSSAMTPLIHVGPPSFGEAFGYAPVWLAGFTGVYPTLRLGAAAHAYEWDAPYSQYGWPAPIGLVVAPGYAAQVTLLGRDMVTGQPVAFGFVEAGVWGAPTFVTPAYTLDTGHPSVPAGGSDPTGVFWYGYVFLPHAGCYDLAATWPGGSWQFTVSAGK